MPNRRSPLIQISELRLAFSYCEGDGRLLRLLKGGRTRPAGFNDGQGYLRVEYRGHSYAVSHIAWALATGAWPPADREVDHINLCKSDNRLSNLRLASDSEQQANQRKRKDNRSGIRGVSYFRGRWRARLRSDGKLIERSFDTREEAAAEYERLARAYFGETYFRPVRQIPEPVSTGAAA